MTRLTTDWINNIPDNMDAYDKNLFSKIGMNLRELAFTAAGKDRCNPQPLLENNKAAVIRTNVGGGVIEGFDKAIAAIFEQVGVDTIVCENENVSGVNEAMDKNANILIMADDDRYIAINTSNNKKAENDYSTALGFATALEIMANGLKGRDIALLGYGRVGKTAANILCDKGGQVWVYDKKPLENIISDNVEGIIKSKAELLDYKFILDFTSEELWFENESKLNNTCISAPGVPLSFNPDKLSESNNIVHDKLEIGTAVMLAQVL